MQEFPDNSVAAQPQPNEASQVNQVEIADLMQRFKSASSWFYVIAGLSLVNSLIAIFGGGWRFIFGLGLTSVANAVIAQSESGGKIIGAIFSLAIAGLFVIFGFLAKKHFHWAYIVGMVFYLLDGVISLLIGDWLGAAFHAYVVYQLFRGLAPSKRLSELNAAGALAS